MTLADGKILYGSSDGGLRSVPFGGGRVTGAPTVVDTDGSWTLPRALRPERRSRARASSPSLTTTHSPRFPTRP